MIWKDKQNKSHPLRHASMRREREPEEETRYPKPLFIKHDFSVHVVPSN